MKKYRLKEDVNKYFQGDMLNEVLPEIDWIVLGASMEALEEVNTSLTYEDVASSLFENEDVYYRLEYESIGVFRCNDSFSNPNNAKTAYQLECHEASNMLTNVANYLNEGYVFEDDEYVFHIVEYKGKLKVYGSYFYKDGSTYFKAEELAQQAIEILGEEKTRMALTKNF